MGMRHQENRRDMDNSSSLRPYGLVEIENKADILGLLRLSNRIAFLLPNEICRIYEERLLIFDECLYPTL